MNRVFSRIRDHENIVAEGGNVQEVLERRKRGNDFDDVMEEDDEELLDYENYDFPTMPSEEDIQRAREIQPAVPYEEDEDDGEEEYDVEEQEEEEGEGEEEEGEDDDGEEEDEEEQEDDEDMMLEGEDNEGEGNDDEEEGEGEEYDEDAISEGNNYPSDDEDRGRDMNDEEYERLKSEAQRGSGKGRGRDNRDKKKIDLSRLSRQTLLFSATALETLEKKEAQFNRKQKPVKLQGTLKGLATGCSLPHNLKE